MNKRTVLLRISVCVFMVLLGLLPGVGEGPVVAAEGITYTAVGWGTQWPGTPSTLIGDDVDVQAIAAGSTHFLALKTNGTVIAWGDDLSWNNYGQWVVPADLENVTAIAAGDYHSLALKEDGTVTCWGGSTYAGQCSLPVELDGVVVTAIAAGDQYSLALKSDGTVVSWGYNYWGGNSVPAGLTGVTAIAAGNSHNLALMADGTVFAWGYDYVGQATVPAGLTYVTAIAAGNSHSLALKSDGTVVAWGYNMFGQTDVPVGLGDVVAIAGGEKQSLALKGDGSVVAWGDEDYGQAIVPLNLATVPAGQSGAIAVAAGGVHSLALVPDIDADGDGVNDYIDNCPTHNPEQHDSDRDGLGDDCDTCMYDPDNDVDEDDHCGDVDNCPFVWNPDQTDTYGNDVGDACGYGGPILSEKFPEGSAVPADTGAPWPMSSAEDIVVVDNPLMIAKVQLWGGYYWPEDTAFPGYVDSFTVRFHNSSGGLPGVVYQQSSMVPERVETGWNPGEYLYTLTLAQPLILEPGTYLIEIYNTGGSADTHFRWEMGSSDSRVLSPVGYAWANEVPGETWSWRDPDWEDGTDGMSLRLIGAPVLDKAVASGPDPTASTAVATASATGTGLVMVAKYEENPVASASFTASGTYFDVYVSPDSSFERVTITACGFTADDQLYWWDGTAWVEASPQSYDSGTGCITLIVDADSMPTISQLQGTVFVAGTVTSSTAPVADPGGPYLGAISTDIAFDGSGSSDPEGGELTYAWDFGDGSNGTDEMPTHAYAAAGIYNTCLTVSDGALDSDPACTMAVVYDPSAGFVTGGGWIESPAGAYKADESLSGKATFGFVSRYKKGAKVPEGNTEFQFQAGGLRFHSTAYEWLVVEGKNKAQFKGSGTVNGGMDPNGNAYKFMLSAGDGSPDTFRIRIWWEDAAGEHDGYDNGSDQAIGGGNIVVHTGK